MEKLTEPAIQPQNEPSPPSTEPRPGISARISGFFRDNRESLRIWLGWRLVIFILPLFVGALIPSPYANKPTFNNPLDPWLDRFIWRWAQDDSTWYLKIAEQGYVDDKTVAFYPLYPFLMRLTALVLGLGQPDDPIFRLAGVVVASLAALVFCVYFFRLILLDYSLQLTRLSLIYFAVFPTSFFLFAVYTESLFLALCVTAFYAARRNRWLIAMILAALAVLTRQQGLILVTALLFEYAHQVGWNWRRVTRQLAYFAIPALALAGWLGWNWLVYGNPLMPVIATQKYWARYLAWPWWSYLLDVAGVFYREPGSTTWEPIQTAYNPALALPLLNVAATTLFIVLAVVGYRVMRKSQFRLAYWVLCLGCLLQPLVSPVAGDPMQSLPRYLLLSFPAFVLLARWGQRSPLFNYCYLGLNLAMLGMLVARFTLGYWVA